MVCCALNYTVGIILQMCSLWILYETHTYTHVYIYVYIYIWHNFLQCRHFHILVYAGGQLVHLQRCYQNININVSWLSWSTDGADISELYVYYSLLPSDATSRHWTRSTLASVMDCCLKKTITITIVDLSSAIYCGFNMRYLLIFYSGLNIANLRLMTYLL